MAVRRGATASYPWKLKNFVWNIKMRMFFFLRIWREDFLLHKGITISAKKSFRLHQVKSETIGIAVFRGKIINMLKEIIGDFN